MTKSNLFKDGLKVVNMGLEGFNQGIRESGGESLQVDWKPRAGGDSRMVDLLDSISEDKKAMIEQANGEALGRILKGKPELVGLSTAREVIPGLSEDTILHAGPPIGWGRMCGPMRGAIIGALMYEGRAYNKEDAEALGSSGIIEYSPCHEHNTVGPMAGIVSPSMPVFVLKNAEFGNQAYCTMNEGLGKVLRYGAYGPEVITKLKWMENVLYPNLRKALESCGPIDIKNIIAQSLHMGDEVHNRNRAATSLFYRKIAPHILRTADSRENAEAVLNFIDGNDHFFLNLSMPACKVTLDAARNIRNSSMVTAMTRNGTDFGIQVSGTGDKWFTGKAPVPDALFFPGYRKEDANPDIGDSSITETNGLGGFAIAASPAIVQFVGGSSSDANEYTLKMYEISVGENNIYQIPYLNFRGTPTGIDIIKVVEKDITPFIDTGVAHREPGVGQVGAGVLMAAKEPFKKALEGFIR